MVLGISAFSCSAFGLVEQYSRAIIELLGSVWYIGLWMNEEIFITGTGPTQMGFCLYGRFSYLGSSEVGDFEIVLDKFGFFQLALIVRV